MVSCRINEYFSCQLQIPHDVHHLLLLNHAAHRIKVCQNEVAAFEFETTKGVQATMTIVYFTLRNMKVIWAHHSVFWNQENILKPHEPRVFTPKYICSL
jgi:superoxide dismutase